MAHAAIMKSLTETAVKEAGLPAFDAETIALKLKDVPDANLPDAIKEEIAARIKANPGTVKPGIDEALEAKAKAGNMTDLGQLQKKYGNEFLAERKAAWAAEKNGTDAETVKAARKIVDNERANSPWNPKKQYPSDEARQKAIAKYITAFGSRSGQKAANFFNVDLAGRPLMRKRA